MPRTFTPVALLAVSITSVVVAAGCGDDGRGDADWTTQVETLRQAAAERW